MVSKLSSLAARVLEHLITRLPEAIAGDPRTYAQYKQVHDALQLPMEGRTFGESLQRQGLEELARWCLTNNLPALTGIVVKGEDYEPGEGFFRLYKRSHEDYKWWAEQIAASKARDWTSLLNEATDAGDRAVRAEVVSRELPRPGAKNLQLDAEFKTFLEGFLRADSRHFVTWLPHYQETVRQIEESIKSENLDSAFNLIWKTPDNGVADAGRGVVSFSDVDRLSDRLKEQLLQIVADPSPSAFARQSTEINQWKDQGLLKISPRLMLARAFAAIAPGSYHSTVDAVRHAVVLRWMEKHSSFRSPATDNWAEQASALVDFLNGIDGLSGAPLVRNMFPWFIYLQASRGGDDRPAFTAGFQERPEQASAVIEAEIRTIRLRHNVLSKRLYHDLMALHGKESVGVDQPSGSGGWVDAVLKLPTGQIWLYEIKVASTASLAIREAIGQLLEYSYRGSAWKPERLFVAAEPELDSDSANYLKLLNQKFLLPIEYLQLTVS